MAKVKNKTATPNVLIAKERKRWKLFGIPWTFTTYTLTEKKLIVKRGFLNIDEDEVLLFRIRDLSVKRPLGLRIWGMGSIDVVSADASLKNFTIENIKHVKNFYNLISQQVESERIRLRYRPGELLEGAGDYDHDYDHDFDHDFDHEFDDFDSSFDSHH